jgi:WD40 repeat protein
LPQTTRRNELGELKREWESLTAGGLENEECAALRKKLLDFQQRWPGSGEAREAATLTASLPTPSASDSSAGGIAGDSFQVSGPAVRNILYNPTGDLVAALVPGRFQVRIWDSESGKLQASLPVQPAQAVAFRPGSREAAVVHGGTAKAWNLDSSRPRKLLPEGLFISAIGYSPDGKLLAACIGGDNKTLIIHDADDGRQIHRFTLESGGARCFAFSPDSRYIATGGETGVRLYDVGAGNVMTRMTEGMAEVAHVGFSGNGKLIATAHSKSWNVQIRTLSGEPKAVIEPDGRPIRGFASMTDGDAVMFYTNRFRETVAFARPTTPPMSTAGRPTPARYCSLPSPAPSPLFLSGPTAAVSPTSSPTVSFASPISKSQTPVNGPVLFACKQG